MRVPPFVPRIPDPVALPGKKPIPKSLINSDQPPRDREVYHA